VRQTLFHIPETIGGYPVFGLGIVLAIWVAICVSILYFLVRRGGSKEGDLLGHAAVMGVIALAIWKLAPMLSDGQGLPIRGYGVLLLCGVITGVGLAAYRAQRMGLDPENIYSLAFVMFIAGVLGARVFYVIQYWNDFRQPTLADTLTAMLSVTNGGLVVYGSVIGGLGAAIIFLRLRKLPVLAIGDIIAPSMLLGLAFGRIGCLMNGCCYGGVCEAALPAMEFPGRSSAVISPPYMHQQMQGQLHGIRLGKDNQGRPIVAHVLPAHVFASDAARKSKLKAGDPVQRILLPFAQSKAAAEYITWPPGAAVEVTTVDQQKFTIPIVPREKSNPESFGKANTLGFQQGVSAVTTVDPEGPAAKAGLKPGMQIESLWLPALDSLETANRVMEFAGTALRLQTAEGVVVDLSVTELRDTSLPVHPTQIYASINAFFLCGFLWFLYPYRTRDGQVFATMLVTYPIARFLLEVIRNDVDSLGWAPLTISQFVSVCLFSAGVCLWIYLWRQPAGTSVFSQSENEQKPAKGSAA